MRLIAVGINLRFEVVGRSSICDDRTGLLGNDIFSPPTWRLRLGEHGIVLQGFLV